ncbi:MAG: bifunctional DNA-formamidopyrimidine glycosylase/DNA-(apurinic or apyrimidinic site) lyase [Candidatus Kariarchaeaceae archaeon]
MPEGPEVEVVRQGLLSTIGHRILDIKISSNRKYQSQKKQLLKLQGYSISTIDRVGKFLLWVFIKNDAKLRLAALNHLGMTGIWYIFSDQEWKVIHEPFNEFKHYKLYFKLDNNTHIIFVDARTFGKFQVMSPKELETHTSIKDTGPDILELPFNIEEFIKRAHGKYKSRKMQIGKLLLKPNIIAGCGNIYKSEALYRAKIHPMTPVNLLSTNQLKELGKQLSNVGQEALESKGATISDYRDVRGYSGLMQYKFKVYGFLDKSCEGCGTNITSGKQDSRTSYWCPNCQKLPSL